MNYFFLFALAGLLLMKRDATVRGIRNNNPGNIKKTSDQWLGLKPVQSDPTFFQFAEPVYGIRALGRLLVNYQKRYGLNTVRGLISRFAPSSENHPESYIDFVANVLKVGQDEVIDVQLRLYDLVVAIIHFENGQQPYDPETIAQGLGLAFA